MDPLISHCLRCGTCCRKGGPALHLADLPILQNGWLRPEQLITIRKGELAYSPKTGRAEPLKRELVKTANRSGEWACVFYDELRKECSIYQHRPLECRLLQCWAPEELMAVSGRDTLTRGDILGPDHPLLESMTQHERDCPCERLLELVASLQTGQPLPMAAAEHLAESIKKDLAFRSLAVQRFNLSLAMELFLFGRPFLKILAGHGLLVRENGHGLHLQWQD
ncbi:MAG: hypothetical protein A2521_13415 [Deltaproteobacteria bacterium RIFOXYD12_FULL_57_12]|nr:MAG: hypothetical protein A2521_13415 [Deltaproteobacteria bacterium RIFOXYD12_FULL_57_12]